LSQRLEEAARGRKVDEIRLPWIDTLSAAAGVPVDVANLVDVQEVQELRDAFFGKVRNGTPDIGRTNIKMEDRRELYDRLASLSPGFADERAVLFSSVDSYIGAVVMPVAAILSRAEAVWSVVNEDLAFASRDVSSGFILEKNHNDLAGNYIPEEILELTTWGNFHIDAVQVPNREAHD
jgi:hypothetical protein